MWYWEIKMYFSVRITELQCVRAILKRTLRILNFPHSANDFRMVYVSVCKANARWKQNLLYWQVYQERRPAWRCSLYLWYYVGFWIVLLDLKEHTVVLISYRGYSQLRFKTTVSPVKAISTLVRILISSWQFTNCSCTFFLTSQHYLEALLPTAMSRDRGTR
jgi:hypothetical protein